jgi:uncharacterized membrane protein YgcG
VLRIGTAGTFITGNQQYEIIYEVSNIVRFYEQYDEFYWDINGTNWGQTFERVRAEVILPNGFSSNDIPEPQCFTGSLGSSQQNCIVTDIEDGYQAVTTSPLLAGQNMSMVIALQKDLFLEPGLSDWVKANIVQLIGLMIFPIGLMVAFIQWQKKGKDHPRRGIIIPQYEPPKGLTPAEVGLIENYSVDTHDLSATIIDLAVRGYLQLHEQRSKTIIGSTKREFSVELKNANIAGLKQHETGMLEALFPDMLPGTMVEMSKVDKAAMSAKVQLIRSKLSDALSKGGSEVYFDRNPKNAKQGMMIGGSVLAFMGFVFPFGWGFTLGFIGAGVSFIIFSLFMQKRSHLGVEAYEHIQGLKLYIQTAEKDRLQHLQSVDRPYVPPQKTVDLYEKLLPFAVALGLEKTWTKQFESVLQQSPNWYNSNTAVFSSAVFAQSIASSVGSFESSFQPPSSSSSSGFSSGGGFSGGGGGGGGGGGW